VLHRDQEPISQALAEPSIHVLDGPVHHVAARRPVPPPDIPAANIANPRPLPHDFAPVELSEALLDELSRSAPAMPHLARFEEAPPKVAPLPHRDPLFSDRTAVPVEDTAQFDSGDDEVADQLADAVTARAASAAPMAYAEPAAGPLGEQIAAFDAQPLSSPASSGY
jgi:hypothetical protein